MARRKKIRVHRLTTVYQTKNSRERVPVIRISGKWLAAAGFDEGSRYTAFSEDEGRIILTVYRSAPSKRVQGASARCTNRRHALNLIRQQLTFMCSRRT